MPFTVLELIKGKDLVQKEKRLQDFLHEAKDAIQTNDIRYINPTDREKRVLKIIFKGLGLPWADIGVNGFVVGYNQDVIDEEIKKI